MLNNHINNTLSSTSSSSTTTYVPKQEEMKKTTLTIINDSRNFRVLPEEIKGGASLSCQIIEEFTADNKPTGNRWVAKASMCAMMNPDSLQPGLGRYHSEIKEIMGLKLFDLLGVRTPEAMLISLCPSSRATVLGIDLTQPCLHIATKYLDGFVTFRQAVGENFLDIYRASPKENLFTITINHDNIPVRGFGRLMAATYILHDIDAIGNTGGNLGFIPSSDKIDPHVVVTKIDPEYILSFMSGIKDNPLQRTIQVATTGSRTLLRYNDLNKHDQAEFLETIKKFILLPKEKFRAALSVGIHPDGFSETEIEATVNGLILRKELCIAAFEPELRAQVSEEINNARQAFSTYLVARNNRQGTQAFTSLKAHIDSLEDREKEATRRLKFLNTAAARHTESTVVGEKWVFQNVAPCTPCITRQNLLNEIANQFLTATVALPSCVLAGLGGIGKTQLAAQYATLAMQNGFAGINYSKVFWFHGEHNLGEQFQLLAETRFGKTGLTVTAAVQEIFESINNQNVLFIFDNIADTVPLLPFIKMPNGTGKHHLLITSRNIEWPGTPTITIPMLQNEELAVVTRYIQTCIPRITPTEKEITTLLQAVGGHPQTLTLVLRQIAMQHASSGDDASSCILTNYLTKFRQQQLDTFTKGISILPLETTGTFLTTILFTLLRLKDMAPLTEAIVNASAYLAEAPIPKLWLSAGLTTNVKAFEDAIILLEKNGLIQRANNEAIRLDSRLKQVILIWYPQWYGGRRLAEHLTHWLKICAEQLLAIPPFTRSSSSSTDPLISSDSKSMETKPMITINSDNTSTTSSSSSSVSKTTIISNALMHAWKLVEVSNEHLEVEPNQLALLLTQLGTHEHAIGHHALAERAYAQALELQQRFYTATHPSILTLQARLAELRQSSMADVPSFSLDIPFQDIKREDKPIGQGSYGKVFRAQWKGRSVAVKECSPNRLTPDIIQEFKQEAAIMGQLHLKAWAQDLYPSPIVSFYGCSMSPYALVMEYLPQGALSDYLRNKNKPANWINQIRFRIMYEIAQGLALLHAENIFHRDLKGANVLLDNDLHAKLSDFGLSLMKNACRGSKNLAGTLPWMAPERLKRNPPPYDAKADIYSLGMTFLEIFLEQPPFTGEEPSGISALIVQGELEPPKNCPAEIKALIERCHQMDPSKRPSAHTVANTLRAYLIKISTISLSPTLLISQEEHKGEKCFTPIPFQSALREHYQTQQTIPRLLYPDTPLSLEALYTQPILTYGKHFIEETKTTVATSSHIAEPQSSNVADNILPASLTLDSLWIRNNGATVSRRHLLIGQPGIGKSTLCRVMAYRWSQYQLYADTFTWLFWLPLRRLSDQTRYPHNKTYTLVDILHQEYFSSFPKEEVAFLLSQLEKERSEVLWLLDGYDEISPLAEYLNPSLSTIVNSFFNTKLWPNVMLGSRPWSLPITKNFDYRVQVEGFSEENAKNYIEKFYTALYDSTQAKTTTIAVWDTLQQPSLKSWLHIPLYLELLCSLQEQQGYIHDANNRAITQTDIYQKLIVLLLRRYLDVSHQGKVKTNNMTSNQISNHRYCAPVLQFLQLLAYRGLQHENIIISNTIFAKTYEEIINFYNGKNNQDSPEIESGLLDWIVKSGFIYPTVESPRPITSHYIFLHRNMQIFFAANYLAESLQLSPTHDRHTEALAFIAVDRPNPHYQAILILTAGLLARVPNAASSVLWNQLVKLHNENNISHLTFLIRCLEETMDEGVHTAEQRYLLEQVDRLLNTISPWAEIQTPYKPKTSSEKSIQAQQKAIWSQQLAPVLQACPRIICRPSLIERFIEYLSQPVANTRLVTAQLLASLGKAAANPQLTTVLLQVALEDKNLSVAEQAALALGQMGALAGQTVSKVLVSLQTQDLRRQKVAIFTLTALTKTANHKIILDACLPLLISKDAGIRFSIVKLLGQLRLVDPTPVINTLIELAQSDPEREIRGAAIESLIFFKEHAVRNPEALSTIASLLAADEKVIHWSTKSLIAKAVGSMGVRANQLAIHTTLTAALQHPQSDLRYAAAWALTQLGKASEHKPIEQLIDLATKNVKDETGTSWSVRQQAIEEIAELNPTMITPATLQILVNLLNDTNEYVRSTAATTLGKLANKITMGLEVATALLAKLKDDNPYVRTRAIDALGQLGVINLEILEGLLATITDKNPLVVDSGIKVLLQVSCQTVLERYLNSRNARYTKIIAQLSLLQGTWIQVINSPPALLLMNSQSVWNTIPLNKSQFDDLLPPLQIAFKQVAIEYGLDISWQKISVDSKGQDHREYKNAPHLTSALIGVGRTWLTHSTSSDTSSTSTPAKVGVASSSSSPLPAKR